MKIVKVLLVGMFVLGICKPVQAFDVKSIKPFGSLDMFTAANVDDRAERRMKADKKGACITENNPQGEPKGISAYTLKSNAAIGFRVGALYPIEDIADVGLSWGYVSGPNGNLKMTDNDGIWKMDINRRFYRFLAEGRKTFKIDDKFSFLGGAGLGVAYGREEYEDKSVGAGTERTEDGKAFEPTKYDKYFSGLAWELTAGAVYKATDKLNVEAGLKYAGFPSNPADPARTRVGKDEADDGSGSDLADGAPGTRLLSL